jgi:lysophospholipase L1-like esterase
VYFVISQVDRFDPRCILARDAKLRFLQSIFMRSFLPLAAACAALFFAGCATNQPASATAPAKSATIVNQFAIPATDDGLPGSGPIRRYDWFQKLWVERRTKWAGEVQKDQHAVVFLGDSITQGWNDDFHNAFPSLKVANRGISGDTTRGVLIRLQEDVISLNPTAVVLLIGTNDLDEKAGPWTIAQNVSLIVDALKKHNPSMPVVLCEVFPSSEEKNRPNYKIKSVNFLLREAMKDQPQVTVLDTWTLFADPQGRAIPAEFPDLLHPNDAGYAKWAAALHPVFATLGLLDTEPDNFTPEPGFTSLFNGHDLTGWGYRPSGAGEIATAQRIQAADFNAPDWPVVKEAVNFDGQTVTPEGRYRAINGRLVVTTPPQYRSIRKLSTTQDFPKNFVLKLEFRATPNADSGIFVRDPQLQCRDYLLAGPYYKLTQYRPQEWNEIVITVKDNVAHCTCNGEVLEDALPVPPTGPIGLEGDRGQMEYRHIRLQELP